MSTSTQGWIPPRELVLASAGSGKTYHLSTRLIELLTHGVAGEEILASTFTRKAAGEIQDRVLIRLASAAKDPGAAKELAKATEHQPTGDPADTRPWLDLLERLLPELHRMRVGTLDAFLVRIALCFGQEMGLPPGWGIVDEALTEQLRADTLDDIMGQADRGVLVELLRLANRGDAIRDVHWRLSSQIDELQEILRQGADGGRAIWAPPLDVPEIPKERVSSLCGSLAERLLDLPTPPDATGVNPNPRWERPMEILAEALRQEDWRAVTNSELIKRFLQGGFPYYRSHPTDPIAEVLRQAIELARSEVGGAMKREVASLGRLARFHDDAHRERTRTLGLLRFHDVTHQVAALGKDESLASVLFRLDSRIRHLLLDEFQDTSLGQWEALRPLASEILQDPTHSRATVIVADPKQSIYGWRNARPQLAAGIGERFDMDRKEMKFSYRSGPIIVDTVQQIMTGLPDNEVAKALNEEGSALQTWMQGLTEQRATRDLPGHVRMTVGPRDEKTGSVRPGFLDFAAEEIETLHREMPGAEIGVLVRSNKAVGFLVGLLRGRGVPASGEGGTSLTDTGPVNVMLSLLRLADHPGDRIARYHVARSPLGTALGYEDHDGDNEARRLSLAVRQSLILDGYGATLAGWADTIESQLSSRERRRMRQFVEEGYAWEPRATLRPSDFLERIERTRREEGSTAPVRVMTIHQSKGLEFDIVVLPDLSQAMVREAAGAAIRVRDETGRIKHVYPGVDKATRGLFPEVEAAFQEDRENRVLDALSVLYVALTRPRYALHLLVSPDGASPSKSRSAANLLRQALSPGERAEAGATLFEAGNPDWAKALVGDARRSIRSRRQPIGQGAEVAGRITLRASRGRRRNLPRKTPSGLEGGGRVDLPSLLRIGPSRGLTLGTLVHAWCERIEWIEDGLPSDETLRSVARKVTPQMERPQVDAAIHKFHPWLQAPSIREVFERSGGAPAGAGTDLHTSVERELPFLVPLDGEVLHGFIDRLVLTRDGDTVVHAWIIDFKTDQVGGVGGAKIKDLVDFYRPQLEAYGVAVEALFQLPASGIKASLAFLSSGDRVDL